MLCIYVYGRITLLLSILILTGGMSFTNLYTVGKVLAVESSCDPKIQSLLECHSGYDKVGSFAIASAKALDGDKKNIDIGIDPIDGTPGASQVGVGNDHPKSNNKSTEIEFLIPSTINANSIFVISLSYTDLEKILR
jgi:hypothetical protein